MRKVLLLILFVSISCSEEKDGIEEMNEQVVREKAEALFEPDEDSTSKFNMYLRGNDSALSIKAKFGLKLFMDAGCVLCHSGKDLGAGNYQMFGIHGPYWKYTGSEERSKGLYDSTGNEADKYMFKIPSMRDSVMSPPYFFDNSINSLDSVIKIMAKLQAMRELSDKESEAIKEFLKGL